ncbi:MAG: metallophosphoesterase family protein [Paludibacteraceae bacterium]|nr:metallophosphoesterase family protein [Paludibacteraceae bacterium]
MKRIGLLSDTHGYWDDRYAIHFKDCDEIWHAGDIGSAEICNKLSEGKLFRSVYGNIDGQDIRIKRQKILSFTCENVKVVMTHIGGYPHKYAPGIKEIIYQEKPQLFVCGHSHILKAMYDPELRVMCLNPGAAGIYGFHKVRTLMRFVIDGSKIRDLEVIELKNRIDSPRLNSFCE